MTSSIPGSPEFVERLLADRIGLDVASVGEGVIHRGVANRMQQLGVRRRDDYERILLSNHDEIQALIEEVVIPESWFFRDDRPFATFRRFVQEGWADQPLRNRISVLCLPCAAGEEPYSVAITLLELGLTSRRFEVVAVDISERSIRRAAAGLYTINAFRGINPQLQTKYFIPSQGRFLLKASVRATVRFEQGNILDPTLLQQHSGFDVVFCRNLLIYFDEQARTRAFANLDRLSAAGGLLFLGHADRSDPTTNTRFVPYADSGSFVYRKRSAAEAIAATHAPQVKPSARPPRTAAHPSPTQPAEPQPQPQPPAMRSRVNEVVPSPPVRPGSPVDRDAILAQAAALAGEGRYDEANRLIQQLMAHSTLDAPAHFLLGIIQQAAGNRVEAEAELTKAIYLDPEHDEALLAMALLARRKGDMAAEAFYRRRAERVLTRKGRA